MECLYGLGDLSCHLPFRVYTVPTCSSIIVPSHRAHPASFRSDIAWRCQAISNADMTEVFGHLRRPATGKFIYARFFYTDVTYSRHIFRLYFCSFVFLFCECVHVIETLARHNCVVPQLNIETYIHSASLIETFVRRGSMII